MRELPLSLFTCKTLTKLKLAVGGSGSDVLNVPPGVILPCVKTLDISVFREPFVHVYKLINGCPVLESLCLSLEALRWGDDTEEYNFTIPTLKRFELRTPRYTSDISKVVLNVPNLEYLILSGVLCSYFVMEDFPSHVEATVSFSEVGYKHLMIELLKGLSEAKSLSWSTSTIGVPLNIPLPKFNYLKRLEFKGFSCFGWFLMFEVLQRSCALEYLCIEEPEGFCWKEPPSVPGCMLSHLRTMKFISFKKRECDIMFLEYLLANAKVLKILTITSEIWPPSDEMLMCAQLLKFPRASSFCEIRFVKKWSH
ncbi:hypothetical protein L2E82_14214 [Cichorium intybus]|uniref:Uncharacterized protein n=1 Tax=Cichorium intybus TaxID=13427 RepID=A0ACB9F001_CICIN|nr:hypothetical protein L2E82_14214 [Cichorium intybus]